MGPARRGNSSEADLGGGVMEGSYFLNGQDLASFKGKDP